MAGGVRGCGGVHGDGGACMGYDEIRSMSGLYASYRNAFLFKFFSPEILISFVLISFG